jgi:hypothetical protein
MDQKRQIEVLNEATNKALSQIRKKRKDDNKIDFIAEFHEWVIFKKFEMIFTH